MNIDQEKMIVEALSSLYPLKDYEEDLLSRVFGIGKKHVTKERHA